MIKFLNFLNNLHSMVKITQSSLPYGIIFYFMILLNLIFLFIEINLSKKIFGMINYSFFLQQKFLTANKKAGFCIIFYIISAGFADYPVIFK